MPRVAAKYWCVGAMKPFAMFQSAAELLVADERLALRCHPPAVLLIGTAEQTSPVIAGLLPECPAPIEACRASTLVLDSAVRTLVLQDADEMSPMRQTALFDWMNAAGDRRVIATSRLPLFPRVESGAFSIALSYRLNIITIDFTDGRHQ